MFSENRIKKAMDISLVPTEEATAEKTVCFRNDFDEPGIVAEDMKSTQLEQTFRKFVNSLPDTTLAFIFLASISRSRSALAKNIYTNKWKEQVDEVRNHTNSLIEDLKALLHAYSLEEDVISLCKEHLRGIKILERDSNE